MDLTHFIGGERVAADLSDESINPSNLDDVVARVPRGGAAEVDAAVRAARAAFPAWSEASPEVRSDLLDRVGSLIMARAKDLGALLSREEGKTLPEGTGEVMRAARIFKYFAGEALRRHGQTLESTRPGIDVTTHREGDVVRIATPGIGALVNRVTTSKAAEPWTFGVRDLMRNLSARGLLQAPAAA